MHKKSVIMLLTAVAMVVCSLLGCGDNGNGPANESPAIASLEASANSVDPTARVTVACTASDGDGDPLAYAWGKDAGEVSGSGSSVTWTAPETVGSYSIWVEVTDGKGGEAADTAEVSVLDGVLLVQTDDGLMAVTLGGVKALFYDTYGEVEVLGDRIFIGPSGTTLELDQDGNLVGSITRPPQIPWASTFVVLPDAGFGFVNNSNDSIYFMDAAGDFVTAGLIPTPSPSGLQSTSGLAVGNRLIMADSQPDQVFAYDLNTHEGSVLRDLLDQNLQPFDIDRSEGAFYVSGSRKVCKFTETGDVETICTLPTGNLTSLAVVGSYTYLSSYAGGVMYKVDIYTGQYEVLVDGLNRPEDVEYLRLAP